MGVHVKIMYNNTANSVKPSNLMSHIFNEAQVHHDCSDL